MLAVGASLLTLALAIDAATGARRLSPARTALGSFRSPALESRLHFVVRLPVGYDSSTNRYPVIYFLHGLPAGRSSYQSLAWVGRALDRDGGGAILVIPQGTRRANGDPEYLNWGTGHNWATALAAELPRYVDRHFRTIPTRGGRAIIGVSAGGYGASTLGLHNPRTYSVVESWSGYFEPTDPTGTHVLDLGSPEKNSAATLHGLASTLGKQFARYPTFLGFFVGRSDTRFLADNEQLDAELSEAGVQHAFAVYPGGHTSALWEAHASAWLEVALRHLAPRRV